MKRLSILAGFTLALAPLGCLRPADHHERLAAQRADYLALKARLDQLTSGDPLLKEASASEGEVLVVIRTALLDEILERVTYEYLDRVELDLPVAAQVHHAGEVRISTFLGKMKAGAWTVDVTIPRVKGVLRAGRAGASLAGKNRVTLRVPVSLQKGEGAATVQFAWDAASLATLACRDARLTETLDWRVLPGEYQLNGAFLLGATTDSIVADPAFPPQAFRMHIDLREDSWSRVRAALEKQDSWARCGAALNPEEALGKLRGLLKDGFNVRLPRSLFRSVRLPASIRQSVTFEGRAVDLAVRTLGLDLRPEALWYVVEVKLRTPQNESDLTKARDSLKQRPSRG